MRFLPRRYVQVRFATDQLYTFKCRDAAVGDLVTVTTSLYPDVPQVVRVVRLGRNLYVGPVKWARKVSS